MLTKLAMNWPEFSARSLAISSSSQKSTIAKNSRARCLARRRANVALTQHAISGRDDGVAAVRQCPYFALCVHLAELSQRIVQVTVQHKGADKLLNKKKTLDAPVLRWI